MQMVQFWRNTKLREHVTALDERGVRASLVHGADPFQMVLDPLGQKGGTTPLLHALVRWPEDGRGVYAVQPFLDTTRLETGRVLRAEDFQPLVQAMMAVGVSVDTRDARGVTLREAARLQGRSSWLTPPLPSRVVPTAWALPRMRA